MHEQVRCCDEVAYHQCHSCSFLNRPNTGSFHGQMFKLNTKFDTDLLLYSLSHFECNSHAVHVLTQRRLLSPLTSTVKSSLFTHVHSSPLSLAARFHPCSANPHTVLVVFNNGRNFSGQTSHVQTQSRLVVAQCSRERGQGMGNAFLSWRIIGLWCVGATKEVRPHHTTLEINLKKKLEVYKASCLQLYIK